MRNIFLKTAIVIICLSLVCFAYSLFPPCGQECSEETCTIKIATCCNAKTIVEGFSIAIQSDCIIDSTEELLVSCEIETPEQNRVKGIEPIIIY